MIKNIKKLVLIFFAINCCLCAFILNQNNKTAFAISNNSAEIVMEVNSKRILFATNEHEKKYMASTTKILTAYLVILNCNMSDIVTVKKENVGIEGSSIYLEEGEQLSVKDLLYGLMLRSGNDCAETLATYCAGSIENFAKMMNDKAKELGALNSNFVNPHGLHDENHYTTAYDLALISCEAMKNDVFREIVGTKSVKIPFTTKNTFRLLKNKNKLLFDFDGSNGIKTGFTKKAGRCLVSSCVRNGMELVSVVLNCPPMFERSKGLINDCFDKYKLYKLVDKNNFIDFVKDDKNRSIGLYIKNDVILPLSNYEKENLDIIYEYPDFIKFDQKNENNVGTIKFYVKNNLIFEEKIYTII